MKHLLLWIARVKEQETGNAFVLPFAYKAYQGL